MDFISKGKVEELAKFHEKFCVSIFLGTHRYGQEARSGYDSLALKNQLKEVRNQVAIHGLTELEINRFLSPVQDLVEDVAFWKYQSEGLAIFLADGYFSKHSLPISFEDFSYLSSEFYIKPLIPLFNGDGRYYLLSLQINEVKLYEQTRFTSTEIIIEDLIPPQLEEAFDYDYEQKNKQLHSLPGKKSTNGNKIDGLFHGHNSQNEKDKNEILKYFSLVNKGIMKFLHEDQNPPLLVACLDSHFGIYKDANSYLNLFPQNLSGNPAESDLVLLHNKAWEILSPHFDQPRIEKIKLFAKYLGTDKTSTDLEDIIPAIFEGKIDSLFLRNKADSFGIYDPFKAKLRIEKAHKVPNVSLLNLAATQVFSQGGNVYLVEADDMPIGSTETNALYRY